MHRLKIKSHLAHPDALHIGEVGEDEVGVRQVFPVLDKLGHDGLVKHLPHL
jgi:hypothetical protein